MSQKFINALFLEPTNAINKFYTTVDQSIFLGVSNITDLSFCDCTKVDKLINSYATHEELIKIVDGLLLNTFVSNNKNKITYLSMHLNNMHYDDVLSATFDKLSINMEEDNNEVEYF